VAINKSMVRANEINFVQNVYIFDVCFQGPVLCTSKAMVRRKRKQAIKESYNKCSAEKWKAFITSPKMLLLLHNKHSSSFAGRGKRTKMAEM